MWTYKKALEVAKTWVRMATDDRCIVIDDSTISKPYGWVFFYGLRPADVQRGEMIGGNAPIIFERINGGITVTGTACSIEHYLAEYEKNIPPVWMQRKPEMQA